MFSNPLNDDPLGISLRQRAYEAKQAYDAQNRELAKQHGQLVSFSNLGPLSDPMWDAWKQSYADQGIDAMRGGSLPESRFGETTAGEGQVPLDITALPRDAMQAIQRSGPRVGVSKKTTPNSGRRFPQPR